MADRAHSISQDGSKMRSHWSTRRVSSAKALVIDAEPTLPPIAPA